MVLNDYADPTVGFACLVKQNSLNLESWEPQVRQHFQPRPMIVASVHLSQKHLTIDIIHQRFGHFHEAYLRLLKHKSVGCPHFNSNDRTAFCPSCAWGKHQRRARRGFRVPRALYPFVVMHTDLMFVKVPSRFGFTNAQIFVCGATHTVEVYFSSDKTAESTMHRFRRFMQEEVIPRGYRVSVIVSDRVKNF